MQIIEKEITKNQIVYELTQEELNNIKREERNKGRHDVIGYLIFVLKHYRYELNIAGMRYFIFDLVDFLTGKTNTIQNICQYSFNDYLDDYR